MTTLVAASGSGKEISNAHADLDLVAGPGYGEAQFFGSL
jgi:hypothetical protein